jgi:hypothetical protein
MKFWTNWGTKEYVVFYAVESWFLILRRIFVKCSWYDLNHGLGNIKNIDVVVQILDAGKHKNHWCCGPDYGRRPYNFETFWKVKNEAICWIYFVVWNIFLLVKKQLVNMILVSMTLTLEFWLCPYVMRRCDINIKLRHEKRILLVLCCLTSLTKIDAITIRICCSQGFFES